MFNLKSSFFLYSADMNLLDLFIGNNLKAVICELFQASVQRLPKLYDRPYWEDLKIVRLVFFSISLT